MIVISLRLVKLFTVFMFCLEEFLCIFFNLALDWGKQISASVFLFFLPVLLYFVNVIVVFNLMQSKLINSFCHSHYIL